MTNLEQEREKWYDDHAAYVIGVNAAIAIIFPDCSNDSKKELLDDCLKTDKCCFSPVYGELIKRKHFIKLDSFTEQCQELYTRGVADFIKTYLDKLPMSIQSSLFTQCVPDENADYWLSWHRIGCDYV